MFPMQFFESQVAAGVADGGSGRWMVLGGGKWWLWPVVAIAQQCSLWQQKREQSALLLSHI